MGFPGSLWLVTSCLAAQCSLGGHKSSPSFCPNSQEQDAPRTLGSAEQRGVPSVSLTPLPRGKNGREASLLWLRSSSLLKDLLFPAVEENQRGDWCLQDLGLKSRTLEGLSYFSQLRTCSFSAGCGWRGPSPPHSPAKSLGGALGVLPRRENTGWGAPLGRLEGP